MSNAEVLFSWDLVMAYDYGQIELTGATAVHASAVQEASTNAIAGDGIGRCGQAVVVLSPHQSNFRVPIRVELRSGPPSPPEADEWVEQFEASLVVENALGLSSPTIEPRTMPVPVPPGRYRLLIAGTGFSDRNTSVIGRKHPERWLIQLWPTGRDVKPRRLHRWVSVEDQRQAALSATRFEASGLEAARRIGDDIDRNGAGRILSAQTETVTVQFTLPGLPKRWWRYLAYQGDWITDGGGAAERYVGHQFWFFGSDIDPEDAIAGTHGRIQCEFLELGGRRFSRFSWIWLATSAPGPWTPDDFAPLLPEPTQVLFNLSSQPNGNEAVDTAATIEHSSLPPEWLADLTDYWTWKLEDLSRRNPEAR